MQLWTRKQLGFFALIALAVLWPLFAVGLNCDDFTYLAFARGISPLSDTWRHVPGALTRPLSTWTFIGLLRGLTKPLLVLGGLRLAHHALNALLVGYLARHALGLAPQMARAAAVIFLLWGSHGELYYFSAIHDVTAATFALYALALSCRSKSSRFDPLALAVASLAAYACKESAWGLPLLLFFLPRRERIGRPARDSVVSAMALLAVLCTRLLSVHSLRGDLEPGIYSNVQVSLLARSTAKLLLRSFMPGRVNIQSLGDLGKQHGVATIAIALFIVGATAFIFRQVRLPESTRSILARISVCFFAALAPVCQLSVSMESQENARYLYLSTAFVALSIATLVDGWSRVAVGATRLAGLGLVAAVLVFQAISLNVAGSRWMEASRLTERYVAALNSFLTSNLTTKHVYVICAPDNYRGAFAARNVSAEIGRMHSWPRPVDVLATRYVFGAEVTKLCRWSENNGHVVVYGDMEKRSLTHPAFYYGQTAALIGPWKITPIDLSNQRSLGLLIKRDSGSFDGVLAVYNGSDFSIISLERS